MIKENDICILYIDGFPSTYVRVEIIIPDSKPDWLEVGLVELTFPLTPIIWKLQEKHLEGDIIYMQGKELSLKPLEPIIVKKETKENLKEAKVIDLEAWKKSKIIFDTSLEIKLTE